MTDNSISNSLKMIKAGIKPDRKHNRKLRGIRYVLYMATGILWYSFLLFIAVWAAVKLIG